MIGTSAGNYRILEKLGEGGMGTVYRAVDEMVERPVALKVLKPEIAQNTEVVERFRGEAIALARLSHPAIATLYSFFRQGDQFFMAMEFVPGETLEKQIARGGALPWQRATEILLRILEGIQHAHEMGILHRDLKPANIMITPDGRVKVTDFGIARVLNTVKLTREARVVGTLEYLAPERALGHPADARSDLYSLGVVYYEMLTGRLPFQADTDFALMRAQIEDKPQPPREIGVSLPPPVEAALLKALAKNPEERFPDAASFAAAFRDAVHTTGEPLAPQAKQTRQAEDRPSKSGVGPALPHWIIGAAAGMALLVLGIGTAMVFHKAPQKPVPQAQTADPFNRPPEADRGLVPIAPPVTLPAASTAPPPEPAPAPAPAAPAAPARAAAAPRNSPAREPAASSTTRILATLDATGLGLLQFAEISAALRIDRTAAPSIITRAVERRGVAFRPTPDQLIELRTAGANDATLRAIVDGYRGAAEPAAPERSTPRAGTPPANLPPPPAKAHAVSALREVRHLYIGPLADNLDEALREAIGKETRGRLDIARTVESADAVMEIEVQDEHGKPVFGAAGRVFGLASKHRAVVRVIEPHSKHVFWSVEEGDRSRLFGDAVKRLATRIAKHLKQDWDR